MPSSAKTPARKAKKKTRASDSESILGGQDASLLDIVDNVLSKGVVLNGDITIGLAQVEPRFGHSRDDPRQPGNAPHASAAADQRFLTSRHVVRPS